VVVDAFAIMSWQGTPARIVNCRENQTKVMTLAAAEFIRRFLLHILPGGFVRIRQFGFLANRARGKKLALCRTMLGAPAPQKVSAEKLGEHKRKLCPACKIGHLVLLRLIPRLDSS
jgi:hypothetical protein